MHSKQVLHRPVEITAFTRHWLAGNSKLPFTAAWPPPLADCSKKTMPGGPNTFYFASEEPLALRKLLTNAKAAYEHLTYEPSITRMG
jgi:hypothetical protein